MAANPRVDGARPRQPHQPHHQVVRHLLLAEVHAVDQVVFQLMGQRGEKCVEQQARPPRHVPGHVERRRTEHAGQGEGQNARAEGVLMLENRVLLAQLDASGQHHFTDMGRSLSGIQSLGACRSTVHASILWLLMVASCLAILRNAVAENANLLTGSANQHD
ncbi:hypothetical protein D3C86_980870 [compost metagenome]